MKNKAYLKVKDHSVSKETFELHYNKTFGFLETIPKPSLELLPKYYKSEDYISHTDAKRNWFEKTYQLVKRYTLNKKVRLINRLNTSAKQVLDVGCGTGDFLCQAKIKGWQVTGIEPNDNARALANKKINNTAFKIEQLLKLKPNSFNVITLWHVLEHLPKLDEHIRLFNKLLAPNGYLVIAVPNYKSYDAKFYKNFWAAYDVPRHLWHFSPLSIKQLFATFNFKVEKQLPMKFDAYYVSLLSEQYKTGNKNIFKAAYVGWLSNFKAKTSKNYSSITYILSKT